MTDTASLKEAINTIRERPGWFEKYANNLYAGFDTASPATRAEITDLCKYTAGFDPQLVAEHTDLLAAGLRDPNPSVCDGAIYAVAIITVDHVEMVANLVPELLAALATAERPDVRVSAVRALTAINQKSEVSVTEGDELFAALLRGGNDLLRDETAGNLAIVVMHNPHDYPHLLQAYVKGLDDPSAEVRESAMKTLAVVARDYPDTVSDIEDLMFQLKQYRRDDELDSDDVERAISMVQDTHDEMAG